MLPHAYDTVSNLELFHQPYQCPLSCALPTIKPWVLEPL